MDLSSVQLYDAADTTFSNPLSRNEYTFHYTSHVDAASVNTYTMELTVPDQRALVLKYTYKTNADVEDKVKLDNTALLNGKWEADSNQTLQDIKAGGYVSQTKLVVHKVDSSNQANGLEGAKFSLYWLDKTTGNGKLPRSKTIQVTKTVSLPFGSVMKNFMRMSTPFTSL